MAIEKIDYKPEGRIPKNRIFSRTGQLNHTHFPPNIHETTTRWLIDAAVSGALNKVPAAREVVLGYFGTNMTINDFAQKHSLSSKEKAQRIIAGQNVVVWKSMPPEVRQRYTRAEVRKLKSRGSWGRKVSDETRKKMSDSRLAIMNKDLKDRIAEKNRRKMTKSRKARLRRLALERITPKERLAISVRSKARINKGHALTDTDRIVAIARRWTKNDISSDQRVKDPFSAALYNLNYVSGDELPTKVREFSIANPSFSLIWQHPISRAGISTYFMYQGARVWYVVETPNAKPRKSEVSESTLSYLWDGSKDFGRDRSTIVFFGRLSKYQIRYGLELRMHAQSIAA